MAAARRVMRMGDSHTVALAAYGDMASTFADSGSGVEWVGSVSTGDGAHEGHGGWAISGLSKHLDEWLADGKPEIVTLLIGTNDAAGNRDPNVMLDDLRILSHKILASGASLILATIPPYPAKSDIQAAYNAGIQRMVPELVADGMRVRLADTDKVLTDEDLGKDKIHLTASGYMKVAHVLSDQVAAEMSALDAQAGTSPVASAGGVLRSLPWWKKVVGLVLVIGVGAYALTTWRKP